MFRDWYETVPPKETILWSGTPSPPPLTGAQLNFMNIWLWPGRQGTDHGYSLILFPLANCSVSLILSCPFYKIKNWEKVTAEIPSSPNSSGKQEAVVKVPKSKELSKVCWSSLCPGL